MEGRVFEDVRKGDKERKRFYIISFNVLGP